MSSSNKKPMKNKITILLLLFTSFLTAQVLPSLIIDNVSNQFSNVSLPYWLKAGQTVDLGSNARSASILEFTIDSNNLIFSQAISLTAAQTVPANKVWKIEGIGVNTQNSFIPSSNGLSNSGSSSLPSNLPTIFQSPKKFETVGTYIWVVPPSVTSICVEVWGAGGGGSYNSSSRGGGGGGYSYQCFTVIPNSSYTVTVGAGGRAGDSFSIVGGDGGTSSLGSLINAAGGTGGNDAVQANGGTGNYINGGNAIGSIGGIGGNGGFGGTSPSFSSGLVGNIPGGGGGGGGTGNCCNSGGPGARGQVYIYW